MRATVNTPARGALVGLLVGTGLASLAALGPW
jgi:hypothetical protein